MWGEPPGTLLVISPHLDDAVLSVGACMADTARRHGHVEVATLFAGAPVGKLSEIAHDFHRNCGLPNDGSAVGIRREEDVAALTSLGARYRHGDFLDAVFRTRGDGSWLCRDERGMFDHTAPAEARLASELAEYVERLVLATAPDMLATCAGVGGHLDHLLTREAVCVVARQCNVTLWFWEDLPYGLGSTKFSPADCCDAQPFVSGFEPQLRKWTAIALYRSQVRMLWGAADWRRLLHEHAIARGGGEPAELLWKWRLTDG